MSEQKDRRPAREMEYVPSEYGGYYVADRKRRVKVSEELDQNYMVDIDDLPGHGD